MIKRVLSFLCASSMIVTAIPMVPIPVAVFASELSCGDFTYTVCGENSASITGYTGSEGVIEIPDTVDGYTVTEIGPYSFAENSVITQVTVPESVGLIGKYAFYCCCNLDAISILNSNCQIIDNYEVSYYGYDYESDESVGIRRTICNYANTEWVWNDFECMEVE